MLILFLILPGVWTIGTTPNPSATFRNYSPLPFKAVQFVKPIPTKKGPILFPNDAPPPPPTPLIVTSRPLSESIARSELNPNNSITAQSQLNQVSYNPNQARYNLNQGRYNPNQSPFNPNQTPFKPEFLARGKNYSPYAYITATGNPLYNYQSTPKPYTDQNAVNDNEEEFYTEYEKRLMETIHQRKYTPKERMLWDKPIYRRNFDQKYPYTFNLRRSIFHEEEPKSTKLKIWHGSLYSREINTYKQNKRNNFNDVYEDIDFFRRKNRDKDTTRNSIDARRTMNLKKRYEIYPPTKPAHDEEDLSQRDYYRIRRKKIESEDLSEEDVIQERSLRPLYALRSRNEYKPIPVKPDSVTYQPKPPTYQSQYTQKNVYDDGNKNGEEYNQGENYAFSYTVKDHKTGDDFSHSQHSTGSATNGEYRVRLPDGRMQIVSYTADENGYKADVRYDEQHNKENSIDNDVSRGNQYRNQAPQYGKTKETNINYYDDIDSRDFSSNKDYIGKRYNAKSSQYYFDATNERKPNNHANTDNDYSQINNDLDKAHISEDNDDYLDHYKNNKNDVSLDKLESIHDRGSDYFKNVDDAPLSHEIDDYSLESTGGYRPHESKFAAFKQSTGVTPSYDSLKHLFVTNTLKRLEKGFPILSTLKPNYEATTENVVLITSKRPNFYTNIKSFSPVTPTPIIFSTAQPSFATTPSSYLVSTIANLKNQINLASNPVLSKQYIERINKYLTYKK